MRTTGLRMRAVVWAVVGVAAWWGSAVEGRQGAGGARPTEAESAGAEAGAREEDAAEVYRGLWAATDPATRAVFDTRFLEREPVETPAWAASAEVAAQLEGAQESIKRLIEGTKLKKCDWKVDLTRGYDGLVVTEYERMRVTARVLYVDGRRLRGAGDFEGSAERMIALTRFGRHVAEMRLVVVVRLAQNLVGMTLTELIRLGEERRLDPVTKRELGRVLREELAGTDPCGMKDALLLEGELLRRAAARFSGPSAGRQMVERLAPRAKAEDRLKSGMDNMDGEQLSREASRTEVMYREVAANWDAPEFVQVVKSIEQQRRNGDYGGVAVLLSQDVQQCRVATARFCAAIAAAGKAVAQ